jgi:hypothetical protein
MTKEEINTNLDKMLIDHKAKAFLNHMVKSYFPSSNVVKVFDKPTGDFKCAITRVKLVSVQEILEITQTEEYKAEFLTTLKIVIDDNKSEVKPTIAKFLGGKNLGFTGKDTNTFLSLEAYQEFYDWVMVKILSGDKHIHWLLNVVKRDGISTKGESNNSSQTKSASFKLGDSNNKLADLKAKLEAQGR